MKITHTSMSSAYGNNYDKKHRGQCKGMEGHSLSSDPPGMLLKRNHWLWDPKVGRQDPQKRGKSPPPTGSSACRPREREACRGAGRGKSVSLHYGKPGRGDRAG